MFRGIWLLLAVSVISAMCQEETAYVPLGTALVYRGVQIEWHMPTGSSCC